MKRGAKAGIDEALGRGVARWVAGVERRPRAVAGAILGLTGILGAFAATHLGVSTDTQAVIDPNVRSRVLYDAFSRVFPGLNDALLVVVDGQTPELTREASDALSAALEAQSELFPDVFVPGGGEFFETHGLLYREVETVAEFADELVTFQPVIANLEADPSVANFAALVSQGLKRSKETDRFGPGQWAALLDQIGEATVAVYEEFPLSVSWEEIMLRDSPIEASTRRVIILQPVLETDRLLAAKPALDAIRQAARRLSLDPDHGVRVRVTGNPALAYEEMLGLVWDVGIAGAAAFALVTLVLLVALRSGRLALLAAITLLVSLVWTTAFGAAAVGRLNVVSIAFAVLVIGLGIDFGIHLAMHYADAVRTGLDSREALRSTTEDVGSSLIMCTVSTAIGFFVFIPTEFLGVAQLALIAGGGVIISLFQTLTLFPALLCSWLPAERGPGDTVPLRFRAAWIPFPDRHPALIVGSGALLALGALLLVPGSRFDANVVNLRDASTESVQTFDELIAERDTTPWFLNLIAPTLEEAVERGEGLSELGVVGRVITLADFVPPDQEEKIAILEDAAFLLDSPGHPDARPKPSVAEQIAALRALRDVLADPTFDAPENVMAASMRRLRGELEHFLDRVEGEGRTERALATLEHVLLGGFDDQMARLRRALAPGFIKGPEDLPHQVVSRYLAADGRARIQIFPAENVGDHEKLAAFVDGVQMREPDAAGVGANLLELLRVTMRSLRQALISALVAISVLLYVLWRRWSEMALVMTPLLFASLLTWAGTVVFDIPFSYATVIVIPLLLGVGVDSGIHLVHRSHRPLPEAGLLGTATARAVFYSALTTIASFGTLAFASHRGIANLGELLTLGMLLMLASNLILLPALLALRRRPSTRQ